MNNLNEDGSTSCHHNPSSSSMKPSPQTDDSGSESSEKNPSTKMPLLQSSSRVNLPTRYGMCKIQIYREPQTKQEHIALIVGKVKPGAVALVRVHSECFTGDVLGSLRCDCGPQLDLALKVMAENGSGILLYLRQEGRGIGLEKKLEAYLLQDQGYDTVEANLKMGFPPDLRNYDIAAWMILDQGVQQVRLLTNNPLKIQGLEQHGIQVVERVPLVTECVSENHFYLKTKQQKMGHMLFEEKFLNNGFH